MRRRFYVLGLGVGLSLPVQSSEVSNLLRDVDWRCTDKPASDSAFESVAWNAATGHLDVDFHFEDSRTRGEVLMSFERYPGLAEFPVDLSAAIIAFTVEVPPGFSGGVQAFASTKVGNDYKNWYGGWTNVNAPGTVPLAIALGTTSPDHEDDGFDESSVIQVGVKMEHRGALEPAGLMGTASIHVFSITPSLATVQPEDPVPFIISGQLPALDVTPRGLTLDGEPFELAGMNWRFGYDVSVGTTAWYPRGAGYRHYRLFVRHELRKAAASGGRILRILLFDDGAPLFDASGNLEPFSSFVPDLDVLFEEAEAAGVMIQLTLFDYLLFGKRGTDDGEAKRGYRDLVETPADWSAFVDQILRPLLQTYGDRIAVLEPANEIDWVISSAHGGGFGSPDLSYPDDTPLDFADFIQCVQDIRSTVAAEAPEVLVTLGVSATAMAMVEPLADQLDFWQLHFYPDSMTGPDKLGEIEDVLASLYQTYPWMTGKPFVLGEYPGNVAPDRFLDAVSMADGGAGMYVWNLAPDIDNRSMTRVGAVDWLARHRELAVRNWLRDIHPALQLAAGASPGSWNLSWAGRPGVLYDVMDSPDLLSWDPKGQVHGIDGPCAIEVTPTSPDRAYFQLQLSEDED